MTDLNAAIMRRLPQVSLRCDNHLPLCTLAPELYLGSPAKEVLRFRNRPVFMPTVYGRGCSIKKHQQRPLFMLRGPANFTQKSPEKFQGEGRGFTYF